MYTFKSFYTEYGFVGEKLTQKELRDTSQEYLD